MSRRIVNLYDDPEGHNDNRHCECRCVCCRPKRRVCCPKPPIIRCPCFPPFPPSPLAPDRVIVRNLVSNVPLNAPLYASLNNPVIDPNLVDAWGITIINNQLWVADNGSNMVTSYGLLGNILLDGVTTNGSPNGIVSNNTSGFLVGIGPSPALWLVSTDNGTIGAWNPTLTANIATTVINNAGSVYKGLAIAGNNLYVADLFNNAIAVFNSAYAPLSGYPFIDPTLPAGYAPFNIYYAGGYLYVAYGLQTVAKTDVQSGPGLGYVSKFTPNGAFVARIINGGAGSQLNAPWGILIAPGSLGLPAGSLVVGNNGDGYINTYDRNGNFLGKLSTVNGSPVNINQLWGMTTNISQNPFHHRPSNAIYFAAGPNNELNGLVGVLLSAGPTIF